MISSNTSFSPKKKKKPTSVTVTTADPFHDYRFDEKAKGIAYYLQCVFGTIFLLPLRVIGIFSSIVLAYIIATLALWGWDRRKINPETNDVYPLPFWRLQMLRPSFFLMGRVVLFFFGFHWVETTGKPASREEAPIVIGNHVSLFEPFLIGYIFNAMPVARIENRKTPLIGTLLDAGQAIFVNRDDPQSRQKTVNNINSRTTPNSGFPHLLIFPEGTTTNGDALITFKGGAFYPGRPVQPIAITYPSHDWKIHWVPGLPMWYLLWRTLINVHNRVHLHFLPPYCPSKEEQKAPLLYGANVRDHMAKAMNVPVSNHSLMDVRFLDKARINDPTFSTSSIADLTSLMDISTSKEKNDLLTFLKLFRKVDVNKDGVIDFNEFSEAVALRFSKMESPRELSKDSLKRLFDLMDLDGSGTLDFREFMLSMLYRNASHDDPFKDRYLNLAFSIYDANDDGKITREEWEAIMKNTKHFDQVVAQGQLMSLDQFKTICRENPSILETAHGVLFDFATITDTPIL